MKKFLIAIIFLIPLIVVVAIHSASDVIEAWGPPVNAESIELRDSLNHDISNGRLIMPRYTYEGEDGISYIYINIYPSVAYSHEITYTLSQEEQYRGECVLEHVDGAKYKITAIKSGDALLRISSATNDNAYQMLNVYITSDYINDLSIYSQTKDQSKRHFEGEELDFAYDMKLYAFAYPIEAVGENEISWQSGNNEIATVDPNGKITPQGVGRVKVTATLSDKTQTEHFTFVFINIYENTVFKQKQVSLTKEFFNELSPREKEDYVIQNLMVSNLQNPVTFDDVFLKYEGQDKLVYEVMGKEIDIKLCDEKELLITSGYLEDIYLENGGYAITVDYNDFNEEAPKDLNYHISDTSILQIDKGRIIPKKKGICDVYVSDSEGNETQTIRLEVKLRAQSFQLNYTNMDNIKGIKQERVWAMNWLENGELINVFNLGYDDQTVYPKNAELNLSWAVDNLEYAEVDTKGNITFKPQSVGNEITLTATVIVHGLPTDLQRHYTFMIVDNERAVNVYSENEFIEVITEDNLERAAVLQNDLNFSTKELDIVNSIYGNGYLIRFDYGEDSDTNDDALTVDGDKLDENLEKLVFENFTIQCAEKYKNGSDKGNAMYLVDINIPIEITNIISRYSWNALYFVDNKQVDVEGSILGNSGFAAIYISYSYYEEQDKKDTITLSNLVFRETNCASLIMAPRAADTDISDKEYIPDIIFEGFIDSYNWKKTDELKSMFEGFDPSLFGSLAPMKKLLDSLMEDLLNSILTDENNSRIVYTDEKGDTWVSMNMFSLGLNERIEKDSFIFQNNDNFEITPVYLPRSIVNTIGKLLKYELSLPCYFMIYKFDEERGPIIKPQDACPENQELFARLKGN